MSFLFIYKINLTKIIKNKPNESKKPNPYHPRNKKLINYTKVAVNSDDDK